MKSFNERNGAKSVNTFDFKTLYTKIPHEKILEEMKWVIEQAFDFARKTYGKKYLMLCKSSAQFQKTTQGKGKHMSQGKVIKMVEFLIKNLYSEVGDKVFRQNIGIPMGTDCAPYLANLFLFALEYKWLHNLVNSNDKSKRKLLNSFRHCFRYIDDLITLNNDLAETFDFSRIYPKVLILEKTNKNGLSAEFLDLQIKVDDNRFNLAIYDKTDDFSFKVFKYPHLDANVHFRRAHGLISGLLLRYSVCSQFNQFSKRAKMATARLLGQGFSKTLLARQIKMFYRSHHAQVCKYLIKEKGFVNQCFE